MQEIINTGIAVNSTAFLDVDSSGAVHTIGNPYGRLRSCCGCAGRDRIMKKLRESVETVSQLILFSTERKYMGTLKRTGEGNTCCS